MSLMDIERLREVAELEFADIVVEAFAPDINELRIVLIDGSFVDIWFSLKLPGRYSYHWERPPRTPPISLHGRCVIELTSGRFNRSCPLRR